MYNKKLRGDFIDPEIDFRGSVANRSKLSICTLPPINTIVGEGPKSTHAKVFAEQYIQAKHSIDQRTTVPVVAPQKTQSISLAKRRGDKSSRIASGNIFSGWSKRISTFGNIMESFEVKEAKQRSVSLPQYHATTNIKNSVHFPPQLESHPHPQPELLPHPRPQQKLLRPPNPDHGIIVNAQQTINKSHKHRQKPRYESSSIKNNHQCHRKKVSFGNNNFTNHKPFVPVHRDTSQLTGNKLTECHPIGGLKNQLENRYVKVEDDLLTNFSNDSSTSLVSKLLESYSRMNLEQQSFEKAKMPDSPGAKALQLNPVEEQKATKRSMTGGTSTHDSTSTNNDLFSFTHSSYTSGSSEFVSLPETGNEDGNSYPNALQTTNYNKELPPVPLKKMDQSILRDYSGAEQDPKIVDSSVPPEVPRHQILPSSNSQHESPELFYDCDTFSFTSSKKSFERNDTKIMERKPEKKDYFPEDTAIFTRKSRQLKGKKKPVPNSKDRTTSWQYLEKVGIEPFMLSGYQSDTPLKVINQ